MFMKISFNLIIAVFVVRMVTSGWGAWSYREPEKKNLNILVGQRQGFVSQNCQIYFHFHGSMFSKLWQGNSKIGGEVTQARHRTVVHSKCLSLAWGTLKMPIGERPCKCVHGKCLPLACASTTGQWPLARLNLSNRFSQLRASCTFSERAHMTQSLSARAWF